jgi:hypothetical protein
MNWEPLIEAFWTALRVGAIILPVFILVDFLNHRYGDMVGKIIKNSNKFMPLAATVLGLLPGCNIAVVVAVFFTQGIASLGTLMAVLIAKSDEALYVFLPLGLEKFIPILVAKFVLAIVAGYLIDFLPQMKISKSKIEKEVEFCCSEHPHHEGMKGEIEHAIKHSIRVVLIVFVILGILNYIQDTFGTGYITYSFVNLKWAEPFIVSIVGLIPGCGTSIAIATLYVKKVITLGAAVAGLSTASGEAFVVLAARGVKSKQIVNIAAILVVVAALGGMIVDLLIK